MTEGTKTQRVTTRRLNLKKSCRNTLHVTIHKLYLYAFEGFIQAFFYPMQYTQKSSWKNTMEVESCVKREVEPGSIFTFMCHLLYFTKSHNGLLTLLFTPGRKNPPPPPLSTIKLKLRVFLKNRMEKWLLKVKHQINFYLRHIFKYPANKVRKILGKLPPKEGGAFGPVF